MRTSRSFAVVRGDLDTQPIHDLHSRVRAQIRELVLADGADEEEAAVLLLVIERLRQIQARRGVQAAEDAARAVKEIWLGS